MPIPLGTKYFVFRHAKYRSTNYIVGVRDYQIYYILFYGYEIRLRRLEILVYCFRRIIFEPEREEVTPAWNKLEIKIFLI